MSPEVQAATVMVNLIKLFSGTGPAAILISIFVMPWIILILISYFQWRRFEAMARMYENNVYLVEDYRDLQKKAQELTTWLIQTVSEMKENVTNNLYCPVVRKNSKPRDIEDHRG